MKKLFPVFFLLVSILSSCGVVVVVWSPTETKTANTNESTTAQSPCRERPDQCEECRTIPKSGNNKDLRYGVYYECSQNFKFFPGQPIKTPKTFLQILYGLSRPVNEENVLLARRISYQAEDILHQGYHIPVRHGLL